MSAVWDEARIQQYITDGVEESLILDYKAAGSLAKTDGKKAEITKDVSAMANSAGGIILYGVAEFPDQARRHLPERIDPVDRTQITKEWLEQVISNIRPKVDGVIIHPVALNTAPNHAAYVVEIPQSSTAHQATDKRYYKRFNFESVAMEDYEIRDIMGRGQYPKIEIGLKIDISKAQLVSGEFVPRHKLVVSVFNAGNVYAQYVNIFIQIPTRLCSLKALTQQAAAPRIVDGQKYLEIPLDNMIDNLGVFNPILPQRIITWWFDLNEGYGTYNDNRIIWTLLADNAPKRSGEIYIRDLERNELKSQ